MTKKTIIFSAVFFAISFVFASSAQATKYFYYDAESGNVGDGLPTPAQAKANPSSNGSGFCQDGCNGGTWAANGIKEATIQSIGGAPQGNKYFQWSIVRNQHSFRTELKNLKTFTVDRWPLVMGTTYYGAYWMRLDRVNGENLYRTDTESGSKDFEMVGLGSGDFRWINSHGSFGGFQCMSTYHWAHNKPGKFTMKTGNPSYHIQPWMDNGGQNYNGYGCDNPIQLDYETWIPVILAVKAACNNTGAVQVWINGTQVYKVENIQTVANTDGTCDGAIRILELGGTLAQAAYDTPPHTAKYDAVILTDNWQDIVDGGYLAGVAQKTPALSICTESWTCSAWTAWSTCTNNSQTQTRTCTDANSCGTTASKPATTGSQSCSVIATTCDRAHYGDCTSQATCEAQNLFWWENACRTIPNPGDMTGSNIFTNGEFNNWTSGMPDGWGTYTANHDNIINDNNSCLLQLDKTQIYQSLTGSKTYRYVINLKSTTGTFEVWNANSTPQSNKYATPGTVTGIISSGSGDSKVYLQSLLGNTTIDSVVVKEITTPAVTTTYSLSNFTQLVTDWLKNITGSPADANKDGKVNSQDLGIMMSNWK